MKILEFKAKSPLFELERDGMKLFTTRQWDSMDPRFIALAHFRQLKAIGRETNDWCIRITNPETGSSFIRRLVDWEWVRHPRFRFANVQRGWAILYLGDVRQQEEGEDDGSGEG